MSVIKEIKNELKAIDLSDKKLKSFGIIVGIIFIVIGLVFTIYNKMQVLFYTGSIGAILLILDLISPKILKPIYQVWMGFSVIIGYFISRLILTILFYLVLTPFSLLAKFFHLFQKNKEENKDSYWLEHKNKNLTKEQIEKLF